MSGSEHTRPLGKLELEDAPPKIVNLVVPTSLSLKVDIDVNTLEAAVVEFVKKQPNLCSGIKRNGVNANFVCLPELHDLFEVLPVNSDWLEVCHKYSNCLIRQDIEHSPPIKVFYIPHSDEKATCNPVLGKAYLVAVYCHYSGDGTNGMTIVNDILSIYENLKYPNGGSYAEMPITPSADQMAMSHFEEVGGKNTISNFQSVKNKEYERCKQSFIDTYLKMYKSFNYFLNYDDEEHAGKGGCVTTAQYYTSSMDVYNNFIRFCKQNKVTVGSTLIAIAHFAFASHAFQDEKVKEQELFIGCNVPINLRDRVPLNLPTNCVNASICQNLLGIGIRKETKFWEFVDKVDKHLQWVMKEKFNLFDYGVMKELSEVQQGIIKKHGVDHQFTVSNMKKYPRSTEYKDFHVDSIHLVGGLWLPTWDHMELMVYSTEKFNFSLVHRDGLSNTDIAKYVFSLIVFMSENVCDLGEEYKLSKLITDQPIPTIS